MMYWKTQNEARHVGGDQQLAVFVAVKVTHCLVLFTGWVPYFFQITFLGIRSPGFELCGVSGVDLMVCE